MPNQVRVGVGLTGVGKASSELDKLRDKFDKIQKQGAKGLVIGAGAGVAMAGINALSSAIGGLGDFIADASKAAADEEVSIRKLGVALEDNVAAWDGNTAAIERVLKARMHLGFSDDEQRENLATIVAVTKDVTKALELQRGAMDISRARNVSLATASDAVAKAYGGNSKGLKSLIPGLKLGANAAETLGNAFQMVNGHADAFAETSSGKLLASQVTLGEKMEELGAISLPWSVQIADWQIDLIEGFGVVSNAVGNAARDMSYAIGLSSKANEEAAAKSKEFVDRVTGDFGRVEDSAEDVEDSVRDLTETFSDMRESMISDAKRILGEAFDPLETRAELYDARSELLAAAQELRDAKTVADKRNATDDIIAALDDQGGALIELAEQGDLTEADIAQFERDVKRHYKDMSAEAVEKVNDVIRRLRVLAGFKNIPINVNVSSPFTGSGKIGNLPGFASGGTVPGPTGAPTLAVVHGGEEVLTPAQQRGGGGFTVNVNVSTAVLTPAIAEQLKQQLRPVFRQLAVESNLIPRGSF